MSAIGTQTVQGVALAPVILASRQPVLQRRCDCGQHTSGGECEECKKKKSDEKSGRDPLLQRAALNHDAARVVPPIVHEVLRSPGQPLDAATRAYFEPRFGQDFSRVRVHADARAAESARAVNALAYTVGHNVVVRNRSLVSHLPESRSTLAHELAHVVQQRGISSTTDRLQIGEPNDPMEREAENHARGLTTPNEQAAFSKESFPSLRKLPIPSEPIPTGPPCPTTIRVGQILRVGHNQAVGTNRTQLRTYFLGIAKMEVGPGPDHSTHCMKESLRLVSTDCPASVVSAVAPCSKSDCLPINGNQGGAYPGGSIHDDETSFLDAHRTRNARSLLEGTGVNSCQTICDQTYSCDSSLNPIVGPTFRITRTFQADTDTLPDGSTVHVTTGRVDKTAVAPPPPPVQQSPGKPVPPPRTLPAGEEYA